MNSLLVYPYVKPRVSCPCGYRKAYRLARVAEHYGADIALDTLLINCAARVLHRGVMQSRRQCACRGFRERRANIAAINQIQFKKSELGTGSLRTSRELFSQNETVA